MASKVFIKTIEDITAVLNVPASKELAFYIPNLAAAQEAEIYPYVDKAFCRALLDKYHAAAHPEFTPAEAEVFDQLQRAAVYIGISYSSVVQNLEFSEAGLLERSDETFTAAKQWRVDDLRDHLQEVGHKAIDAALEVLFANLEATEFALFKNSSACKLLQSLVIRDAETFSGWHDISNSRRIFITLIPIMRTVQKFHLQEIFYPVWDLLETADYKDILENVQLALVKLTIAKACNLSIIKVAPSGLKLFTRTAERKQTIPDQQQQKHLHDECTREATISIEQALKVLNREASSIKYPDWYNSDRYTDPNKAITTVSNDCSNKIFMA